MYIAQQTQQHVELQFVLDEIDLPEGAIEIDEAQYLQAVNARDAGATLSIVDDALVVPVPRWYAVSYGVFDGYGEAVGFQESYVPIDNAVAVTAEDKDAALDALNTRSAMLSIATGSLVVTERPAPTIEMRRLEKRAAIDSAYERAMQLIKSRYPQSEVDGWPEQVAALKQYDTDPQAENVVIDGLAADNGIGRADMAERIRGRRIVYLAFYTAMTGRRHLLLNQLDAIPVQAADAPAQIAAIDESTLVTLAQQHLQGEQ